MQKITTDLLQKSGIYCIVNVKNQKRYIGSTTNLYIRLHQHKSYLLRNCHQNKRLQNSWNRYGKECFNYYILEFCDVDKLTEREQFYIDTLHPEFNFTILVERNILSKESRLKQSKTRKQLFAEKKLMPNHCHEVHQYDLTGQYIQSFYSIYEACRQTKLHPSTIIRCLKGQCRRGGNFLWAYIKETCLPPYHKTRRSSNYKTKSVLLIDIIQNKTTLFPSIKNLMSQLNIGRHIIQYHIKHKTVYKKRYMFQYSAV